MPTLRGVREYRPFDHYDCFEPMKLSAAGVRLLGDTNIGRERLSSVQVAGQLLCDQTGIITNMYARTNIPLPPAFRHPQIYAQICAGGLRDCHPTPVEEAFAEFAESALVTLQIGEMPQAQIALSTLLRRHHGDVREMRFGLLREDAMDHLAMKMRETFVTWPADNPPVMAWDDLSEDDRVRWRRSAALAYRSVGAHPIGVVPVRQKVSVHVQASVHATAKLRELMPKDIAPMPLVWIHLEGVGTRVS